MKNFCVVVNTHTKLRDVWPMFFGQLNDFLHQIDKRYIFVDETNHNFGKNFETIFYDKNKQYSEQMIDCFPNVKEEYCLYLQEDYILYDKVDWDSLKKCVEFMDINRDVDFIKLIRGAEEIEKVSDENSMGLFLNYIKQSDMYYTTQPTIWRTNKLTDIFKNTPTSHIGDDNQLHFEVLAHKACVDNCIGLVYHNNEPKRGTHHYDSNIFPYSASAIVRGKWNISEYAAELKPLLKKYNIDINLRGCV